MAHVNRVRFASGICRPLGWIGLFTALVIRSGSAAPGDLDQGFQHVQQSPALGTSWGAVSCQADGKLLVAGGGRVWRRHANGTLDESFQSALLPVRSINQLALAADGRILVRGYSVSAGPLVTVVCLNSDGTLDESFVPQVGSDEEVSHAIFGSDGSVLLGIWPRARIRRLRPNGVSDPSFQTVQLDGLLSCLLPLENGMFLAGGAFGKKWHPRHARRPGARKREC
jgi:hypothetical protein